jgi:hypothetical protein
VAESAVIDPVIISGARYGSGGCRYTNFRITGTMAANSLRIDLSFTRIVMQKDSELQPTQIAADVRLRFSSFAQSGDRWLGFADTVPGATLYHRRPWQELLHAAHGIDTQVATLESNGEIIAGCLFARSSLLPRQRLISLPDSELCPPLARDDASRIALLEALAAHPEARKGFEIHGVAAPFPWQTVDFFALWTIDMRQAQEMLLRSLDRDIRRNVRRAQEAGISVSNSDSFAHLRRFYSLHLETRRRLGVPPRPLQYFKTLHQIFSPRASLSVWLATQRGCDLAGLVMLHEGDTLYAKMNARSTDCPGGANHLLFVSAMEEFAGRVDIWDLGRVDTRNAGLNDFKQRLGARPSPLPYAYLPRAPRHVSSEVLSGPARILSRAWRRLPLWSTRLLGAVVYKMII